MKSPHLNIKEKMNMACRILFQTRYYTYTHKYSPVFIKPFPKRQILATSKLKDFADDSFKFDEYVGKFSEMVENTVGKGKIAHYQQFFLFLWCFQKIYTADTENKVLFRKGLRPSLS